MEEDTKNDKTPEKVTPAEVKNDNESSQLKSKSPKDDTAGEKKVKKNETSETSPLKSKTPKPIIKTPEKENITKDEEKKNSSSSPSTPKPKHSPEKKSPSSSQSNKTSPSPSKSSEHQNRPPLLLVSLILFHKNIC